MSIPLLKLGHLLVLAFDDPATGLERIERGVSLLQDADARDYLGLGLLYQGQARCRLGQLDEARADIRAGIELVSHTASPDDHVEALEAMADWLTADGAWETALRAWGAVERAREDLRAPFTQGELAWMKPLWARSRRAVGEPRATLAWQAGRSMELRAAVDAALQSLAAADPSMAEAGSRRTGSGTVPRLVDLTAREVEVLGLLAEGCSDGEIGERLFISKKTASVHVANIKGKLGTTSRVETALAAVRLGVMRSGD